MKISEFVEILDIFDFNLDKIINCLNEKDIDGAINRIQKMKKSIYKIMGENNGEKQKSKE